MQSQAIVVMGVSGSGKSSVGKALADHLGWAFYDADDFHSAENVAKMASGTPLNDDDRRPWLADLHTLLATSQPLVLAASALKQTYRSQMRGELLTVQFVYLKGSYDLIWSRMQQRDGHFMRADMLQSQFDTLEEPTHALTVSIEDSIDAIVAQIGRRLAADST